MQWCWSAYVPKEYFNNKYAIPARATSFKDVAPAIIALAEHDVLRDDGANYAIALEKAGVPVKLKEYPGMIHGFFGHGFKSSNTRRFNGRRAKSRCSRLPDVCRSYVR
jgi:acetyl esterase